MSETISKVNCFFNAPYLGGAERSFVHQARDLRTSKERLGIKCEFRFIIPYLNHPGEDRKLSDLLIQNGFRSQQIVYFKYHKSLYGLSRSDIQKLGPLKWPALLFLPYYLWSFISTLQNLNRINLAQTNLWWIGGNKIGPIAFTLSFFQGFKGRMLWHFRDYPSFGVFFNFFWRVIKFFSSASVEFMGNSYDVSQKLNQVVPQGSLCWTLYNPIGDISYAPSAIQKEKGDFILSTASMFAPWKGVHFLVHFACLFEQELRALGIQEFHVYGDEIYKTKGEHSGYKEQLKHLVKQFGSSFIKFKGLRPPEEIFKQSDFFIHGALRAEPFGRVIIEAYRSGTPLISTGLGGSGELIDDGSSALIYRAYDYFGLLESVARITSDDRFTFLQEGRYKGDAIEMIYHDQLKEVFS